MINLFNKKRDKIKTLFGSSLLLVLILSQVFFVSTSFAATTYSTWGGPSGTYYTAPQATPPSGDIDFDCSWIKPLSVCSLSQFLYITIVKLSSWFMAIFGQLFNVIIQYTIINATSNMFPEGSKNGYINEAWTIFRDIVNIALIFVIVYIGIMTIIKGTEFGTKRMLATVIAVAIFLNFSMFFTKLFIDFGNIASININSVLSNSIGNNNPDKTVAGYILSALGLNDLVGAGLNGDSGSASPVAKMIEDEDYGGLLLYGFFASAIMIVTGLVLLVASLMFFMRYIILIFLLIFSSAAVGSHILPSLRSKGWDKWFQTLIGQVFLAPAFLLMLLVSSYVINAVARGFAGNSKKVTGWFDLFGQNSPGIADAILGQVIPFMVVMAFLIGSIIFSKKLSDMGGGLAGTITKTMAGAGLSVASWGSMKLLGGASSRVLNSKAAKNWANDKDSGFKRLVGGASLALGSKAAKGTWDPRNAIGVSALLKKTGVDFGAANKSNLEGDKKAAAKLKEERANRRKYTDEQKAAEDAKAAEAARIAREQKTKELEAAGRLTSEVVELASKETAVLEAQVKKENEALDAVQKTITNTQSKIDALEAEKNTTLPPGRREEIGKELEKIKREMQESTRKKEEHTKSIENHSRAIEITSAADNKIKEFEEKQKNVKRDYYARLAGVDPETGGNAKGVGAWIRRGVEIVKPASNGQARAMYKKEKKGKSDEDKFMEEVLKRVKKEEAKKEKENTES